MTTSPTYHPTRLRQIALVSPDLALARHLLTTIFSVPVIFEDPAVSQWGLHNFLIPLGGDIIEVVSPLANHHNTTAGRLLQKRGEGGYMIIMQTTNADARRKEIETAGKGKVIFSHRFEHRYRSWEGVKDEGVCVQYHPKGVKGGMMPELDSHVASERNGEPVRERFSPWHPCGDEFERYVEVMKRASGLFLLGCVLRLGEGDEDVERAVRQWSDTFGVQGMRDELVFTNCRMGFGKGEKGREEGLVSVTVGVEGKERMRGILERARKEGVGVGDGWFEAVGVRWYLVLMDEPKAHI